MIVYIIIEKYYGDGGSDVCEVHDDKATAERRFDELLDHCWNADWLRLDAWDTSKGRCVEEGLLTPGRRRAYL